MTRSQNTGGVQKPEMKSVSQFATGLHKNYQPTLGDGDVQDPQPDGDHNPEPVKVTLRGACGAEAISRKPWTTVYSAERGWW